MANPIQESIYKAVDTLVSQRIDKLQLDKTVTATIVSCINALTGEYKVSYNGGYMTAFANEGNTYNANTQVYVLIPEGNFTKPKYIVSKAQALNNDNNISFVSSALSSYNLIGRNTITDKDKAFPQGLHSYLHKDAVLIYDRNNQEDSLVSIDEYELANNLKEAEALMIEASFQTRLPKLHRLSNTGLYGVKFTLAFKDAAKSQVQFQETQAEINNFILSDLTYDIDSIESENIREQLSNFKEYVNIVWGNSALTFEEKNELINSIIQKVKKWVLQQSSSFLTMQEKEQLVSSFENIDLSDVNSEEQEEFIKYYDYDIDINNMTGNPYLFNSWSDQYNIFPIDTENFLYVQQIVFYSQDFEPVDDLKNNTLYGADIFIKELEIYGLRTITAKNGDYTLKLSAYQGNTFKSILSSETLEITGTLKNKTANISDSAMFYWFVEDNRVTALSEDYQFYGGAGWRYLKDKKNSSSFITSGVENKAYENKYLCVCVYQDTVILKEQFILYNDAARRQLSISSSLGVKFSFDAGTPRLVCQIDGKSENFEEDELIPHPDDYFYFIWSKTDESGMTTLFNRTIEDIELEKDQIMNDPDIQQKAGLLLDLKAQKQSLQGVNFEIGKNWIEYPTKQIMSNGSAIFKCSVYLKDTELGEMYSIGSAEIVLQNSLVATPLDYYIIIENGDQVFQYSESGVSPDDERYQDPLEIKPLTCHFYYPTGEEVDSAQYGVKWLVPLDNTLIVTPKEGMITNPATERIEWNTSQVYATAIKPDYDYQALNNQVTCIVNFNGQEHTRETSFLFTKVGENGTNGTDLVAKISPTSNNKILEKEMLTLELHNNFPIDNDTYSAWNTGQKLTEKVLDFDLYQRNQQLDNIGASWKMSGGDTTKSKYLSVDAGIISWKLFDDMVDIGEDESIYNSDEVLKRMFRNQIVRAETTYERNKYYAFYPIPIINYLEDFTGTSKKYEVSINSKLTLKSITYNADGRNPLYNKNQGISIQINALSKADQPKYIVWTAEGGAVEDKAPYIDNPNNCCFQLIREKNSADGKQILEPILDEESNTWEELTNFYILPNDVYDGAYSNNLVHGRVYSDYFTYKNGGNPETEIYIPIYMSLNTHGLASLNAWDGNHIEINEDENYILAPQIGAGVKDNENKFTGIVMGKAETYDKKDASVGLLGYSAGKQSIWLDAETGNAIFGLPEDQASTNNKFTEGRIELIPGGESKIGAWRIGSKSLFNMGNDEPVKPNKSYTDAPKNADIVIPHEAQGILLNSDPSFISLKTLPLGEDSGIKFDDANTVLHKNDALELELDPNKPSVFSIYRHVAIPGEKWDEDTQSTIEDYDNIQGYDRRHKLVGINANGQFFTNAVENGESSMGIGPVGAFGATAADYRYTGVQFAYNGNNLIKMFTDSSNNSSVTGQTDLYISTGSTKTNEYPRSMNLYGKSISLYASNISKSDTSEHTIQLNSDGLLMGHGERNFLYLPSLDNKDSVSKLNISSNLIISTPHDRELLINSGTKSSLSMSNGDTHISTSNDYMLDIGNIGEFSANKSLAYIVGNTKGKTITGSIADSSALLANFEDNSAKIQLNGLNNDNKSILHSNSGWNITSKTGGIYLKGSNSSEGIVLEALPPNGKSAQGIRMSMVPQDGGNDEFTLNVAGKGVFQTTSKIKLTDVDVAGWTFSEPVAGNKGMIANGLLYTRGNQYVTSGSWFQFPNSATKYDTTFLCNGNALIASSLCAKGSVTAPNYYWNQLNTLSGTYYSSSRYNIWDHLVDIWNALNTTRKRTEDIWNNLNPRVNNAQSRADSAYAWCEGLNAGKLEKSTFNTHTHRMRYNGGYKVLTSWDTYYVSGVGNISHIKSTADLHDLNTDMPN